MARTIRPGQLRAGSFFDITASFAAAAEAVGGTEGVGVAVQPGTSSFLLTSASLNLLEITNTGLLIMATQSAEITGSAPIGGMYFTSASFYIGL